MVNSGYGKNNFNSAAIFGGTYIIIPHLVTEYTITAGPRIIMEVRRNPTPPDTVSTIPKISKIYNDLKENPAYVSFLISLLVGGSIMVDTYTIELVSPDKGLSHIIIRATSCLENPKLQGGNFYQSSTIQSKTLQLSSISTNLEVQYFKSISQPITCAALNFTFSTMDIENGVTLDEFDIDFVYDTIVKSTFPSLENLLFGKNCNDTDECDLTLDEIKETGFVGWYSFNIAQKVSGIYIEIYLTPMQILGFPVRAEKEYLLIGNAPDDKYEFISANLDNINIQKMQELVIGTYFGNLIPNSTEYGANKHIHNGIIWNIVDPYGTEKYPSYYYSNQRMELIPNDYANIVNLIPVGDSFVSTFGKDESIHWNVQLQAFTDPIYAIPAQLTMGTKGERAVGILTVHNHSSYSINTFYTNILKMLSPEYMEQACKFLINNHEEFRKDFADICTYGMSPIEEDTYFVNVSLYKLTPSEASFVIYITFPNDISQSQSTQLNKPSHAQRFFKRNKKKEKE